MSARRVSISGSVAPLPFSAAIVLWRRAQQLRVVAALWRRAQQQSVGTILQNINIIISIYDQAHINTYCCILYQAYNLARVAIII